MTDNGDIKLEPEQTPHPEEEKKENETETPNEKNETNENTELDDLKKEIADLKAANQTLTAKLNELFKTSPTPADQGEKLPPDAGGSMQSLAESIVNDPNSITSRLLRELGGK